VTVDLDLDPLIPGADMQTGFTDANGAYVFSDIRWSTEDADVTIVVPLGFEAIAPVDGHTLAGIQVDQTADFSLGCLTPEGNARSMGYWKHQAKVYIKNKGNAQEAEANMATAFPLSIFDHFHENELNSIAVEGVTFVDNGNGPEPIDIETLHATLTIKGNAGMVAKAKQQYLALLLNVASGKLLTTSIISTDGGTASQALQQIAESINDELGLNDEAAKDIGDVINNAQLVESGIIDLGIINIAYRPGQGGGTVLMGALQNPFRGSSQIRYRLGEDTSVLLEVYDIRGRLVGTLVDGTETPGEHTVSWDGRDRSGRTVGSGIYYLRFVAGDVRSTRSVVRLP